MIFDKYLEIRNLEEAWDSGSEMDKLIIELGYHQIYKSIKAKDVRPVDSDEEIEDEDE